MQEEYTFSRFYQNSQVSTSSEQTTLFSQLQCSPEFNLLKSKQNSFHRNEVKKSREKIFEAKRERIMIQEFLKPKITSKEEEESNQELNLLMSRIDLGEDLEPQIQISYQETSPSFFEKEFYEQQKREEEERKYYEDLYYQTQLEKQIEELLEQDQEK